MLPVLLPALGITISDKAQCARNERRGGVNTLGAKGMGHQVTTVCIDEYIDGVMRGRFYHRSFDGGRAFHSAVQFLLEMERMLDAAESPKAYAARRLFADPLGMPTENSDEICQTGRLATFAVRIIFRQNAGWQGSVTWLEGGQEQSFRSVLELLLLLDSALTFQQSA